MHRRWTAGERPLGRRRVSWPRGVVLGGRSDDVELGTRAVGGVITSAADALVRPARGVAEWLRHPSGRRNRRVSVVGDRAHIEVRGLGDPKRPGLHAAVRKAVEELDGVDWAEVDAIVGRLVFVFDPESVELDDVLSTIEDVEDAHDAADERFPHDRPEHPGDREPIQRQLFAIAADAAGMGYATASQLLHFAPIPAEIPGLVSFVDSQPRVRRLLEDRLGPPATDVVVSSTSALVPALGQGPIGLFTDIANRSGLLAEQLARRDAWSRREPELIHGRHSVRQDPVDLPARPAPLPKGPVERYADGAAITSLGLVGGTFALTRNPRRSVDLLLAGVPKAATLGREAFAAEHQRVDVARLVVRPRGAADGGAGERGEDQSSKCGFCLHRSPLLSRRGRRRRFRGVSARTSARGTRRTSRARRRSRTRTSSTG